MNLRSVLVAGALTVAALGGTVGAAGAAMAAAPPAPPACTHAADHAKTRGLADRCTPTAPLGTYQRDGATVDIPAGTGVRVFVWADPGDRVISAWFDTAGYGPVNVMGHGWVTDTGYYSDGGAGLPLPAGEVARGYYWDIAASPLGVSTIYPHATCEDTAS